MWSLLDWPTLSNLDGLHRFYATYYGFCLRLNLAMPCIFVYQTSYSIVAELLEWSEL